MTRRKMRAFTLIELMIVVAIIGILAAIAVPSFIRMSCKSKQSEAKFFLKQIFVAEEAYRGEHDLYLGFLPAQQEIIGVVVSGNNRYTYSVSTNATGTTFEALAVANATTGVDMGLDQWRTTEANNVINDVDHCASL